MHEYGTSSEQLAWIKVAASQHAQHNPNAMLRNLVTVEDVLSFPMVSEPLHRLECCVISDGGGAMNLLRIVQRRSRFGMLPLRAGSCCHGVASVIELTGIPGVFARTASRRRSSGRSLPGRARFTPSQ